ncbi:MAG TPA: peptidoglycan bridge formation glycyltransferase FemA/FemB family protein [Anaerolineales bacterium]
MRVFGGTGSEWNSLVARMPGAHLLQTWEWAQVKAEVGWSPMPMVWEAEGPTATKRPVAAAMILRRQVLSRGFVRRLCLLYAPKGPLLQWDDEKLRATVLSDMESLARQERAILLKIDPDIELGRGYPDAPESQTSNPITEDLSRRHWKFSEGQVQFRNTVALDLAPTEEELLARMKQKTRYNVRLAEKKGVTVRAGTQDDIAELFRMYAETSSRDGFVIRTPEYYRSVWETFLRPFGGYDQPSAEALIAQVEGQDIAAVFVFFFAQRAYYLYGMSREAHREKMPNYLLQWKAIQRAKVLGCRTYDLWGAPDQLIESDPLWGVYRFKEGLGGEVVRTPGAWDFPASAFWYRIYTHVVPSILNVMRARGRQQTRAEMDGT